MNFVQKLPNKKFSSLIQDTRENKEIFICTSCKSIIDKLVFIENLYCCPSCDKHYFMPLKERILSLFDTFSEKDTQLTSLNPLNFTDYEDKLQKNYIKNSTYDSSCWGIATLNGQSISACFLDFSFFGGSMGMITGEKIAKMFEYSLEKKIPAFILSASGGARMQEGLFSLMQMAKTSALISKMKEENLFYLSLLTHPTTGGVAASFSFLGNIIIAEPKALIGFAGPRVIEETLKQKLPPGFQTSEFLLSKGLIDLITPRKNLKTTLDYFFKFFSKN